jgi:hypothetical protein
MKYRRVGSSFKRNINISEESNNFKKRKVPDVIAYIESEIAEEKNKLGAQFISSSVEPTPNESEIISNKMSYFSDDGSKIAYYTNGSSGKKITIYSFNFTNYTKTYIKDISINSCQFECRSGERCFVSNDGKYILLSVPSNSSVYFYSVDTGSLLQTITDEQINFGSSIAADENLYTFVASTYELKSTPTPYDVRSTAEGSCSVVKYYKRNFKSNQPQEYRLLHSSPARGVFFANTYPFYAVNFFLFPTQPPPLPEVSAWAIFGEVYLQDENTHHLQGICRVSDVYCKKNNYCLGTINLKQDQLLYKSKFLNHDSPRYSSIKNSLIPDGTNNYFMWSVLNYQPQQLNTILQFMKNDADYNLQNYYMVDPINFSTFSFLDKLNNDSYVSNNSYLNMNIAGDNLYIGENKFWLNPDSSSTFTYSLDCQNLNTNNSESFLSKFISISSVFRVSWFTGTTESGGMLAYVKFTNNNGINELFEKIQDEILEYKCGLNDVDQIIVTKHKRKSGVQCLCISKFPIKNSTGTSHFQYFDLKYDENQSKYTIEPYDLSYGLIKIIHKENERQLLEDSFINQEEYTEYFANDFGMNYQKPFLNDPLICPSCNFAISNNIISENIINIYVSDKLLFINFDTKTLIFKFGTDSCKSLNYINEIDTLKNYKFTYNNTGSYLGYENKLYVYQENSNSLTEIITL